MDKETKKITTVDEYIAEFSDSVKERLELIRKTIRKAAPDAKEMIGWGMPSYRGKHYLIHFAGFRNHVSIFPGADGVAAFLEELGDYKVSKGTIQFQNSQEIPVDLIRRITEYRAAKDESDG